MHRPKVLADRFRIFRFVKQTHDECGEIPSVADVGKHLGVSEACIRHAFRALRNADGFPRTPGREWRLKYDAHRVRAGNVAAMSRGENFDENALLLADIFAVTDGR